MTAPKRLRDTAAGITAATNNGAEPDGREPTSWRPIDLTDALAGTDLPPPELLRRTDGVPLLYRGKVHWFQGESETAKTWVADLAATQVLEDAGRVLWIDFEDDERTVVARLKALGIKEQTIADQLTYIRPEEPLGDRHERISAAELDFEDLLAGPPFDLVVVDGVTEAMLTEGLDLRDNSDIAAFMRRLPRRLADTGAAVVGLDHVTKDREGRGRYAIGGQHKLAGLSGAAYRFDVVKAFSRPAGTDPSTGTVVLSIAKDRLGYIRARAIDDRIAVAELTGWPDGGVTVTLTPPDDTQAPPTTLCRKIVEHLRTYEGASQRSIETDVEGRGPAIRAALKWMADPTRLWIRVEKVGLTHCHYLTEQGHEYFSDE